MKTWLRSAATSVLAAAALVGCGHKEEAATPTPGSGTQLGMQGGNVIRIGHVAPLSGGDAHLGKDNENGARLAADEINAAGGVRLGDKIYRVEILGEDDKSDPKEGTLAAQKLVDAGVVAVVGHLNSGSSIPASKIYNDAGVVQISPSTTAAKYTEQGFKTAFRVVANDIQQGTAMANYAIDNFKAKSVAIIDDRTAYGQGLVDVIEHALKDHGVSVVAREYTNNKASDFNAILTKIRARQPDVIVYGGMDDTAGPMAKQIHQLGIKAPLLAGDGTCSPEFIKLAGIGADVLTCSRAGEAVEKLPKGAQFMAKYKAKFGTEVQIYAPYAYDAVYVIVDAIRRAGSLDRAAIAAAVATTDYDGLTGHISFDSKGDIKNGAISMFHVEGGQLNYLSTTR
ncbi:MAG TPA: branched-chain amino acid ABC transporter substrate-binding protein [Burkholderiaceae bacterium]|nr:branched-chain amino acid ABC transporter substrate-binding protein [Burkholderiaceae bacterium]